MTVESLLQAKRAPVRPHRRAYHRAYLGNLLAGHFHIPLVVIEAPPGYGKTTLLSAIAHRPNAQVGWLTLDATDAALNTFTANVCAALYRLPIVSDYHVLDPGDIRPAVQLVVNGMRELGIETLVLDNFERVAESPAVNYLVEQAAADLPPPLQIIIATQRPPLLKRTARGRVARLDITESDLRFDPEDVVGYFAQAARYDLSADEGGLIVERTGGQAAVVNLVLQLAYGLPSYLRINFETLLTPAGESAPVLLLREFLRRLPTPFDEAVRLLKNGDMETPAGRELHQALAAANCLVHTLDDDNRTLVVHPLLRELSKRL
ncbi:MAG: AAA family ATPase [Chloracidobacterium sp.]|nr:AAA family ATPase [Chloracidobacterium sp.]MDW8217354.1 AAA family ATPase [Acidobacteriota bacterium]